MEKATDTIVRAVTFPVAAPIGCTWQELDTALRACWQDSTQLANWAATTLYAQDIRRKPADTKLAPMPKGIYLYGLAGKEYAQWSAWEGCRSSAQSLLRGVEKKYRGKRFELLWRSSVSLPTHRYPYPYPVHNACWSGEFIDGKPVISLTVKGQRLQVRLKSGSEFRRQLSLFRLLADGTCKQGELALYRQGLPPNRHVMVKLVGHFPKSPKKSGHTILVRTDPNAFWVSEREGVPPWIVNADHVRRWIESHKCYLQRIAEDTKHEKRWPVEMLRNINKARELRCQKQHNRLDSWCHESTAMLVAWTERQGAGVLLYDDTCQDYLPSFPWFALRTKLAYKLEAAGIEFVHGGQTEEVA